LRKCTTFPAAAFWNPRTVDIDKNGVIWARYRVVTLGSFDRRKCKCPLIWAERHPAIQLPGRLDDHISIPPAPGFEGVGGEQRRRSSYYTLWLEPAHTVTDWARNIPISTRQTSVTASWALKDGKMVTIRIPYPLSFYAKGLDWADRRSERRLEGRGLWSTNGDRTPWLKEGGKGSMPRAVHIQFRARSAGKLRFAENLNAPRCPVGCDAFAQYYVPSDSHLA